MVIDTVASVADRPGIWGLMQDRPLTLDLLIDHAKRWHGTREIVSRHSDGTIERRTYADIHADAARLSNALLAYGIVPGDRVATLATNSAAHLAAWYAISGIGAVCHTLNPRLPHDQLDYIINHAGDRLILADGDFSPLLEAVISRCPQVERIIYFTPRSSLELGERACLLSEFLGTASPCCAWGQFDERLAAGLCYTSGTTGRPKGVLYSHRSNVLHALISIQPDAFNLKACDVVLPIVPMYHANAWGLAFSAPAVGAKLVLPGLRLDGASLYDLIERERVTFAVGVPTVWFHVLDRMRVEKRTPPSLKRVLIGGAAPSARLIRDFHDLGIEALHAWGMTEMSPVGTVCAPMPEIADLDFDAQLSYRIKQGRPPVGVDMRIVGENGSEPPRDGRTMGALQVRGPTTASAYFREDLQALTEDGFFDTGDIATIDAYGFMQITDRAKDLIKSGGEWISSIEVENAALLHPKVALAAAIGVPHPKWNERPILFVQLKEGQGITQDELLTHLTAHMTKWWIPDRVVILRQIPLGPTGKVDKNRLRTLDPLST